MKRKKRKKMKTQQRADLCRQTVDCSTGQALPVSSSLASFVPFVPRKQKVPRTCVGPSLLEDQPTLWQLWRRLVLSQLLLILFFFCLFFEQLLLYPFHGTVSTIHQPLLDCTLYSHRALTTKLLYGAIDVEPPEYHRI